MRYAIANKNTVLVPELVSTTPSTYPVTAFKVFRKFSTRELARAYKQSRRNPQDYSIIDLKQEAIVR